MPSASSEIGGAFSIFVFSYNRPRFLDNCIASILRHAPGVPIRVLDDQSSDPAVPQVLRKWRRDEGIEVIETGRPEGGLRGGLYDNMQRAYERGLADGCSLALFVQDDMQLVRSVSSTDVAAIGNHFDACPNAIELQVTFRKAMYRARDAGRFEVDRTGCVYLDEGKLGPARHYSDVGIFHLARMKERGWVFEQGEAENNRRAAAIGSVLGCYAYPFMMYLPFPHGVYYRRRRALLRACEWWIGAGFHPYLDLTADRLAKLHDRPLCELPFAEDYLEAEGLRKAAPWVFGGAIIGAIERGGAFGRMAGMAGRIVKTLS